MEFHYHYTNFLIAIEILNSRCLWLTHCKDLKDKNEGTIFINNPQNCKANELNCYQCEENLYCKNWDCLSYHNLYIASFSTNPNNGYLWDEYTNDMGINIGFDFTDMCIGNFYISSIENKNKRLETNIDRPTSGFIRPQFKCDYLSSEEIINSVRQHYQNLIEKLNKVQQNIDKYSSEDIQNEFKNAKIINMNDINSDIIQEFNKESYNNSLSEKMCLLLQLGIFHNMKYNEGYERNKKKLYYKEEESRMYYYLYRKIPFYCDKTNKRYIKFNFEPNIIKEITLGPKIKEDEEKFINYFIKSNSDYNHIRIRRSKQRKV